MTDIFVSYAHEDELRVKPIIEELKQSGLSVFWDRSIPVGKTWHSHIEKTLLESRSVVVVWSRFSIISEWVIEEAEYAKGQQTLVPLLIDSVPPPFGFKRIQAANLAGWNNDRSHPEFQKCLDAVMSIITPSNSLLKDGVDISQGVEVAQAITTPPNVVLIRGGIFTMGSPLSEVNRSDNETQHQVKVSDFYLGKYAVTVSEFKEFMEASGYRTDAEKEDGSYIWDGKTWEKRAGIHWRHGVSGKERPSDEYNHPVLHVSWNDAVAYCSWRSIITEKQFRLPTEAEWEYACRAGTATPFSTGENITTAQANYHGHYPYNKNKAGLFRENTVAVESFEPNRWGLYNMHGNVWEWCSDWYGQNYYDECMAKGVVENPVGPETGSGRVLRGGGWHSRARRCRSSFRNRNTPDFRDCNVGFRLVFVS